MSTSKKAKPTKPKGSKAKVRMQPRKEGQMSGKVFAASLVLREPQISIEDLAAKCEATGRSLKKATLADARLWTRHLLWLMGKLDDGPATDE